MRISIASAIFACAALVLVATLSVPSQTVAEPDKEKLYLEPLDVHPKPIHDDPSVRYDYDIVYVRAHRAGDHVHKEFYEARRIFQRPGTDAKAG